VPKSRTSFWTAKFESNKARDERNLDALTAAGWKVLVLWECELRDRELISKIKKFLE